MDTAEQARFERLYQRHLLALKVQGKRPKTIDAYSRAVRRLRDHFDRCPDTLSPRQLRAYFAVLVDSHSWSTVKLDRCGLQFFYVHVLERDWDWARIVEPPQVRRLPDIFTVEELARLLRAVRRLRFRALFLTTYSLGLRLGEGLQLQVGDIDACAARVHVREGKGGKDRFVPLPGLTSPIAAGSAAANGPATCIAACSVPWIKAEDRNGVRITPPRCEARPRRARRQRSCCCRAPRSAACVVPVRAFDRRSVPYAVDGLAIAGRSGAG